MTEREYIVATSLAHVQDARHCLDTVTPTVGIPAQELQTVRAALARWQMALHERCTIEVDRGGL